MRVIALVLALLSVDALAQRKGGRFDRTNSRCSQGRTDRGLPCDDVFFSFAPTSGAGMGAACACTTPTGAKGEAMTFTRTGAATCSKQGLATTGIANGDLVECASNDQPRVEPSGGVLGLRVESARTNSLLRFIDYANATWADVATPTLTGAQASPWTGTYASLAVQFDDNDALAFEGRSQAVTVTAAAVYTMSCYVKAGTLAKARLSLDGTTADFTGLSSTSWTLATVTDASSSGVSISAQALNGTVVGDTGTVIWGGCQVEAGAYATSMIPTVAAAATRNAEAPSFSLGASSWGCQSASFVVSGYAASGNNQRVLGLTVGADLYDQYINFSGATLQHFTFLSAVTRQHATSNAPAAAGSANRVVYRQNGTTLVTELNGTTTTSTPAAYTPLNGAATLYLGRYSAAGYELSGIISQVQVDPSSSRCSP